MGFLGKIAKRAIREGIKAHKANERERVREQKSILKFQAKESTKRQKEEVKAAQRRSKLDEKVSLLAREEQLEKLKIVNIRLTIDEEFDWVGSHVF